MRTEPRQYLLALPPELGSTGRDDLEDFAVWFEITFISSTREFLRKLPELEAPYIAFIACLTAVDILSGYRYDSGNLQSRFARFIREYFPATYSPHAEVLYECRKTVIHDFSPGRRAILVHKSSDIHLTPFQGRVYLCADVLTSDLAAASDSYFDQVRKDATLLANFRTRAGNTAGGTMTQIIRIPLLPDLPPLILKRLP